MRKRTWIVLTGLLIIGSLHSQQGCNQFYHKKFTQKELTDDVNFIREKILQVHINPFTEISEDEFESNVQSVIGSLKDGMTQRDFYFLINPLFVQLNDEHSLLGDFCITDSMKANFKFFPLRFKYINEKVILTENYSNEEISIGDELLSVNGISIGDILDNCSPMICGINEERRSGFVDKLWLYLPKFCYFITDSFQLSFATKNKILIRSQTAIEFTNNYKKQHNNLQATSVISYEKIKGVGYLTINSFDTRGKYTMPIFQQKIDSVFSVIKKDKVKTLFIDIHNNGGGNSVVGNLLIDYFSNQSYKGYSGKWKKSQEYSDLQKTLNLHDENYESLTNGDIMPLVSGTNQPTANKNRFKGKTYIVVGENTFSSAMMFAVIVSDNKLATLVGEIPTKGHPNHFGEVISFKTPNTQLYFSFSVKEWIRPSGEVENNRLIPDIQIDLKNQTNEQIIDLVK